MSNLICGIACSLFQGHLVVIMFLNISSSELLVLVLVLLLICYLHFQGPVETISLLIGHLH